MPQTCKVAGMLGMGTTQAAAVATPPAGPAVAAAAVQKWCTSDAGGKEQLLSTATFTVFVTVGSGTSMFTVLRPWGVGLDN